MSKSGRFTPQQSPVQDSTSSDRSSTTLAARSSPFASGPVAMVNQIRPGFGASGQFPNHAVRATPTQLSTPLVPQRHHSTTGNTVVESTLPPPIDRPPFESDAAYDLFGQAGTTTTNLFGQHGTSTQPFQPSSDPSGSPSDLFPSFQGHNKMTRITNDMSGDFIGSPSAQGQPNQQNAFNNSASTSASMLTVTFLDSSSAPTPPPLSRSLSSSRIARQHTPFQQQQSSLHPAGQEPPPPAAPFLGYGMDIRSKSFRSPQAETSVSGSLIDKPNVPSSLISTPSEVTVQALPPSRIELEAASSNDLVNEFLKRPVDERFTGAGNANPPAHKLLLTAIPDTVDGLEALYAQKRWKSLIKKSLAMLQSPSNDTKWTLEIKSWWLTGLIKEGQYDNAASVLDQIGNLDGHSMGLSFVPIRLVLLQALLTKCQGKVESHEKQLYNLRLRLFSAIQQKETMSRVGLELKEAARWLQIVQFALANHLLSQQKFTLALRVCSQIDVQYLDEIDKVVVLSRVGRIHLQMGDLTGAQKVFDAALKHSSQITANGTVISAEMMEELKARVLLNDGLLFFAKNRLQEALRAFEAILCSQKTPVLTRENSDAELFLDEDVVCSAVNNYAICALYCSDVKTAVTALEGMIRSNPRRFLNGVVVFNLSSLYDLQFDNAKSKSRKEMLKKIAQLYDLEHVDPIAYRI